MRRKDRQSSEAEALELLDRGEYGVLSVVDGDGQPYGVPLSYAFREGQIVFHSAPEGRKIKCLLPGAEASFCVVGAVERIPAKFSTGYESVIASGAIRELEGEEKHAALLWLIEKYSSGFIEQGRAYIASDTHKTRVFSLAVRHLSGKARL